MTTKERLDRHDREIAAIRKLLQTGMRMLVKAEEDRAATRVDFATLRQDQIALRKEMKELAAMQKRTEATLQAFIESMKRGGNGHSKRASEIR